MDYISTRGQDGPLGFEQALLSGLGTRWRPLSAGGMAAFQQGRNCRDERPVLCRAGWSYHGTIL